MTRRARPHPDFSDPDPFKPHTRDHCNKWCKVHMIWDFDLGQNVSYPQQFNILTSTYGWLNVDVFVGPPAYYPKRVTLAAISQIRSGRNWKHVK